MKLGLKLWSTNTGVYFEEAKRLYEKGWFDYIELYVVPNTLETIEKWKILNIPFTLHAPHFEHGINLAKKKYEETNIEIFEEVKTFLTELDAKYVVVHSGLEGDIEETIRQLKAINLPKMLIENKPFKAPLGERKFCRGATIDEIKKIIKEIKCGFCLDIGHAICTANFLQHPPYEYLNQLNLLDPICYHLSDNFLTSAIDKHLHLGQGNYDLKKIFDIIDLNKNIAIETEKNSKDNLNDFVEDVKYIRGLQIE